jgi:hypothetical protein
MGAKTSLVPGSQAVTEYLEDLGLQIHLDTLGFGPSTRLPHRGEQHPELSAPPREECPGLGALGQRYTDAVDGDILEAPSHSAARHGE